MSNSGDYTGAGAIHTGWRGDLQRLFAPPMKTSRGPSLADYLENPERHPEVSGHPQLPPLRAMARPPADPRALMAATRLEAPMPMPNSEITAPGQALSSVATQAPAMADPQAARIPMHGMEPPDAPWTGTLAQAEAADMARAILRARGQTAKDQAIAASTAQSDARAGQDTRRNMQALMGDSGARPMPGTERTLADLVEGFRAMVSQPFGQAYAEGYRNPQRRP